jgi:hypothetical protein
MRAILRDTRCSAAKTAGDAYGNSTARQRPVYLGTASFGRARRWATARRDARPDRAGIPEFRSGHRPTDLFA